MILMFGPAGSGKSLQGQILAARHGWQWISVGAVLREQTDPEIMATLAKGELLPGRITNRLVAERLDREPDLSTIILDGYPRSLDQAEALIDYLTKRDNGGIEVVIVLDVGREEIMRRLALRSRSDDTADAIERRLNIFAEQGQEILDYLDEQGVLIERVAGNRSVGQVHDQIEEIISHLR